MPDARSARGFVRQKQTEGKIFLRLFCDERAASQYCRGAKRAAPKRSAPRGRTPTRTIRIAKPLRLNPKPNSSSSASLSLRRRFVEGDYVALQADTERTTATRRDLNEGVPVTSRAHKRKGRQKAACHRSGSLPLKKIWSGRRGSNPRPRPWQGRALPLSYTRIRDGGERSPSTADLCQMPTVNATVRMRSNAARIIRFHQQWPRIGPK